MVLRFGSWGNGGVSSGRGDGVMLNIDIKCFSHFWFRL